MAESTTTETEKQAHWDATYRDRGIGGVSWFQPTPKVSIELIRLLETPTDAAIIDLGGGASTLVDELLRDGFSDLSVLDLSAFALKALSERLVAEAAVTLICHDLLTWTPNRRFDLWHDRAVFHFLIEARDHRKYVERMHQALAPGGHVIVGTFAFDGPQYCSGLPVARYTTEELSEALGEDFEVLEHKREEHITPTGVMQPFTWIAARLRK